jgi:TolB-like protein
MKVLRNFIFLVLLAFLQLTCSSLPEQTLPDQSVQSLEQAVKSSAQSIESRLPQGSKVAVLTFTSSSQTFSNYIIDEIADAIFTGDKLQVIERMYIDAIRRELNIQMSGDVSDDEIRRVGNQLGAQYVITGSLVDVGNSYRFRMVAINVETAVREGSASSSLSPNDPQVTFLLNGQRSVSTSTFTPTAPISTAPTPAPTASAVSPNAPAPVASTPAVPTPAPAVTPNATASPPVIAQPNLSLDGTWVNSFGIMNVFNGKTARLGNTASITNSDIREAVRRGTVREGDVTIKDVTQTGYLTWSCKIAVLNPDTYRIDIWADGVIQLDPGGQFYTVIRRSSSVTIDPPSGPVYRVQ